MVPEDCHVSKDKVSVLVKLRSHRFARVAGVTLVEVLVASVVLGIVFLSTAGVMWASVLSSHGAMERDIMLDFMHHYIEMARALPYESVASGQPINALYDGTRTILLPDGTKTKVEVRFPASDGNWKTLWDSNMRYFHPDLEWFDGREPQYRCAIRTQTSTTSGSPRARLIRLEVRWHPPLRGAKTFQALAMDTVIYPDFN